MSDDTHCKMIMYRKVPEEYFSRKVRIDLNTGAVYLDVEDYMDCMLGRMTTLESLGFYFQGYFSEEHKPSEKETTKSDGGATSYYDMPFNEWVTTNDMMEYLAEHKWGKYGIHLKDIFKGICRWGDKDGTDESYDTRKIIYYGVRVLRLLVGTDKTREYLQSLLDDPQFQKEESKCGEY